MRATAVIADAKEFRIRRLPLAARETLSFAAGEQARILSVVEGRISTPQGEILMRGDNVILPYSVKNSFIADIGSLVLVTENFSG